jgi:hypothetical protein
MLLSLSFFLTCSVCHRWRTKKKKKKEEGSKGYEAAWEEMGRQTASAHAGRREREREAAPRWLLGPGGGKAGWARLVPPRPFSNKTVFQFCFSEMVFCFLL